MAISSRESVQVCFKGCALWGPIMPPRVLSAKTLAATAGVEPSVVGPGAMVPSSGHTPARAPEVLPTEGSDPGGIVCLGFDWM